MAIEWNRLKLPLSLTSRSHEGRPIISRLKQKWSIMRSAQLKHVIHYLEEIQLINTRGEKENAQQLEKLAEKLIVLYAGVMEWKRLKPLEIADMEVENEADELQRDLESVMQDLIGNSKTYLNPGHIAKDSSKWEQHKELNVTIRGRMRNALQRFQSDNSDITMTPANGWQATTTAGRYALSGAKQVKTVYENAPLVVGASAVAAPPVVAGGAVIATGVGNAVAVRSVLRTHNHIVSLEQMKKDALHKYPSTATEAGNGFPCKPLVGVKVVNITEHDEIRNDVLSYLIEQKRKKRFNKALASIPSVGMITTAKSVATAAITAESMLRNGFGSRPNLRLLAAKKLTDHFFTHNCPLAQDILSELFSGEDKMEWLKWQEYKVVVGLIMMKFKDK